jgi:hypothetical protein
MEKAGRANSKAIEEPELQDWGLPENPIESLISNKPVYLTILHGAE